MAVISARKDRIWRQQPEGESLIRAKIDEALKCVDGAADFAKRLEQYAAIRLRDIVDHLALAPDDIKAAQAAGWRRGTDDVWRNPEGLFPALIERERTEIWLRVESIDQFKIATGISAPTEGKPGASLRRGIAFARADTCFGVIERNGFAGYDTSDEDDGYIRLARVGLQRFRARRREFDTVEHGLDYTEKLVDDVVAAVGSHRACDLWLKAERDYWMRRCHAGAVQKQRQDALGVGWANIDHHTYDGSRRHFRRTIGILEKLGYELREMLYAGELAGWGSQVLEQPVIGSTIFADVDLGPDELLVDFAHEELPELPKHRRAGLVSALLGESILEAGLNHVAALYDQNLFRSQMQALGIGMMPPFSSFPHLYQELTTGDWFPVDPTRVDELERAGHINAAEAERLRLDGTVATHLENIERNDAYKGFNREGIDNVLRKLDPRGYEKPPGKR